VGLGQCEIEYFDASVEVVVRFVGQVVGNEHGVELVLEAWPLEVLAIVVEFGKHSVDLPAESAREQQLHLQQSRSHLPEQLHIDLLLEGGHAAEQLLDLEGGEVERLESHLELYFAFLVEGRRGVEEGDCGGEGNRDAAMPQNCVQQAAGLHWGRKYRWHFEVFCALEDNDLPELPGLLRVPEDEV
jgi:hypothetical protein